jgi:hypothetical protein
MLIDASGHLAKAHCFRQMGAKSFAFFSSGSLLETLEDPYFMLSSIIPAARCYRG